MVYLNHKDQGRSILGQAWFSFRFFFNRLGCLLHCEDQLHYHGWTRTGLTITNKNDFLNLKTSLQASAATVTIQRNFGKTNCLYLWMRNFAKMTAKFRFTRATKIRKPFNEISLVIFWRILATAKDNQRTSPLFILQRTVNESQTPKKRKQTNKTDAGPDGSSQQTFFFPFFGSNAECTAMRLYFLPILHRVRPTSSGNDS